MHPMVSVDGQILPAAQARLPIAAAGTLYGSGVFTTLRLTHGVAFQWDLHVARLLAGIRALNLPGAGELDTATWLADLNALATANEASTSQSRIAIVEGEGDLWFAGHARDSRPHTLIFTRPLAPPKAGAAAGLSSWQVHSGARLRGHKLLSYVEPWHALGDAREQGFHEAVRLNERGEVACGCRCALLWEIDGSLRTASEGCGGVRSTTLAWAREHLESTGRELVSGAYGAVELDHARELLLLSAGVGVRSVSSFRGRTLPGDSGELAGELRAAYMAASGGGPMQSAPVHGNTI